MTHREFHNLVKDYFFLTRSERRGNFILAAILMFSMAAYLFADKLNFNKKITEKEKAQFLAWAGKLEQPVKINRLKLFTFDPNSISEAALDSLGIPAAVKSNLIRYRKKGGNFRVPGDFNKLYGVTDSLFAQISPYIFIPAREKNIRPVKADIKSEATQFLFDPNVVSEDELTRLDFNTFQKSNLIKYRENGKKFVRKTDLLKVYGIDTAFYNRIAGYIVIEENQATSVKNESRELTEINQADSSDLVKLPGIGPFFAGRIVRYRNILGGYYSVEQLREVYGMTKEILGQFQYHIYVDTIKIRSIRLNFDDEKSFDRHPYISRQQAKQIITLRSVQGSFRDSKELLDKGIFDEASFKKIKPYITCH